MPRYRSVDLTFEPYIGPSAQSTGVFVKESRPESIVGELGKDWWPENSPRQPYFEEQIRRIAESLNSVGVPVHIEWQSGERNQLDKGCIGHSFASQDALIESIARNFSGEITHIIIREENAPNN